MRRKTFSRFGMLLLAVGLVMCGVGMSRMNLGRFTPVNMPISLSVGQTRTPEFECAIDADYWVAIKTDANLPAQRLTCLLGIDDEFEKLPWKCDNTPSVLKTTWAVATNGVKVHEGSSDSSANGSLNGYGATRYLGSFRGSRGQRYVLELNALQDGTALNAARPHLFVMASALQIEEALASAERIAKVGVALTLTGIAMMLASAAMRSRKAVPAVVGR